MTPEEPTNKADAEKLSAVDKALFMEAWDLKEGTMSDEEILMAIKLGHL